MRNVNGYLLPEVNSPTSGFWCRMGSAAECGLIGGGAHFAWMFTTVVWISQADTLPIGPSENGNISHRTLFIDSSGYLGARFGMSGGNHVVAPLQYNSVQGSKFGQVALCPLGQAVVIQVGVRFIGGNPNLSVRTSADPTWKDEPIFMPSTMAGLANYHLGYSGAAADRFPGAVGDVYGVTGSDSTITVNEKLWKAIRAKFQII